MARRRPEGDALHQRAGRPGRGGQLPAAGAGRPDHAVGAVRQPRAGDLADAGALLACDAATSGPVSRPRRCPAARTRCGCPWAATTWWSTPTTRGSRAVSCSISPPPPLPVPEAPGGHWTDRERRVMSDDLSRADPAGGALPAAPRFDLAGRVALVTGAARGIGRGCAIALAQAGADLALGFRDAARTRRARCWRRSRRWAGARCRCRWT